MGARRRSSIPRSTASASPPVRRATLAARARAYYLAVSRLVPYKRVDLLVAAFLALPQRRLMVIGEGPRAASLARAAPANVEFRGRADAADLVRLVQRARALVHAAEEDFGIALVEAQAAGTPVIAYAGGGATEIVRGLDAHAPTGVIFAAQSTAAVVEAITAFEARSRASRRGPAGQRGALCVERFRRAVHRLRRAGPCRRTVSRARLRPEAAAATMAVSSGYYSAGLPLSAASSPFTCRSPFCRRNAHRVRRCPFHPRRRLSRPRQPPRWSSACGLRRVRPGLWSSAVVGYLALTLPGAWFGGARDLRWSAAELSLMPAARERRGRLPGLELPRTAAARWSSHSARRSRRVTIR